MVVTIAVDGADHSRSGPGRQRREACRKHIKVSEFNRLDQDMERFESRLTEYDPLIQKQKAAA